MGIDNTITISECVQVGSILISVITVAKCATLFHRYEAQVLGGRTPVLLFSAPELKATGPAAAMLPIPPCIRDEAAPMETDSFLGKVVAFYSWFFLIHSRILCLVIAKEIYPLTTLITVGIHIVLMLSYQLASHPTSFFELPFKLLNAIFSIVALVEVSLRFHKVTLLYALFFISIFVEDTTLTILFFIYSSNICSEGILSCDNFGMYTYLIINSHVIGIMLFGIYLSRYQPGSKPLIPRLSTSSSS